jgi:hypothetical protein
MADERPRHVPRGFQASARRYFQVLRCGQLRNPRKRRYNSDSVFRGVSSAGRAADS